MHGEGKTGIPLADKKRHDRLSDGGTRKFHLVSKVSIEKSASTN